MTRNEAVGTRLETAADAPFLFELFAHVKGPDMASMPIPDSMRRQLLEMQFRGMTQSYRAGFPNGYFQIVTLDDTPVGRLITDESGGLLHVVYIALLPEWRNRGIATTLMTEIIEAPARRGLRCEASVAFDNHASLRLWAKLGFVERARGSADVIVERAPRA